MSNQKKDDTKKRKLDEDTSMQRLDEMTNMLTRIQWKTDALFERSCNIKDEDINTLISYFKSVGCKTSDTSDVGKKVEDWARFARTKLEKQPACVPQDLREDANQFLKNVYNLYINSNKLNSKVKELLGKYGQRVDDLNNIFEEVLQQLLNSPEPGFFKLHSIQNILTKPPPEPQPLLDSRQLAALSDDFFLAEFALNPNANQFDMAQNQQQPTLTEEQATTTANNFNTQLF